MSPHLSFHDYLDTLSPAERNALVSQLHAFPVAAPQEGPQTAVFSSPADVIGYGGAAGGGKSALAALLALHEHERTVVFRREKVQLSSWVDDLVMFAGTDEGLNRQAGVFRYKSPTGLKIIEWGGLKDPDDWLAWRGRPHDLIILEEATEIPFSLFKKVIGWLRSTTPGQRCRIVCTFNPPGSPDTNASETSQMIQASGRWVVDFFAPWLSERHKNPAAPGELRYFFRDAKGNEIEKMDARPEIVTLGDKTFTNYPQSRTFIPALVTDNAYLRDTGYVSHLLSLEEPFRSQMLLGDFRSGIVDDEDQLIKSKWVDDAMDRWESQKHMMRGQPMNALGVDVSRGGQDDSTFVGRHKFWWDKIDTLTGEYSDSGPKVASRCVELVRDNADICIDVSGVGSSPFDFLRQSGIEPIPVMSQRQRGIPQPEDVVKCYNLRASLWLLMSKILNPAYGCDAALPPDKRLRSELVAVRRKHTTAETFQVEDKKEVKKRLGFSPDRADAAVYTLMDILDEPWGEKLKSDSHYVPDTFNNLYASHSQSNWQAM